MTKTSTCNGRTLFPSQCLKQRIEQDNTAYIKTKTYLWFTQKFFSRWINLLNGLTMHVKLFIEGLKQQRYSLWQTYNEMTFTSFTVHAKAKTDVPNNLSAVSTWITKCDKIPSSRRTIRVLYSQTITKRAKYMPIWLASNNRKTSSMMS